MQIMVSAGEASGEFYGAQLIEFLRRLAPEATFFGMGGEKMASAGCQLLVHAKDVAVVGLVEVLTHLPAIRREFHKLVAEAQKRRPAAAVVIDFPDFNLRLARQLHRLDIPVFYFVSPQLWAWRSGRVNLVRKYVRKMIVIFPFEREFYKRHGVESSYVGHPLAHQAEPAQPRNEFALQSGLNPEKDWIALLPGSRKREVQMNLPPMLEAVQKLGSSHEYVLPVASTLRMEWLRQQLGPSAASIHLTADSRLALKHSRAAVVASGTATVEAALAETPFVVVYRLAALTWLLGRRLVKLDTFAMPNLIAGRRVVTELIQNDLTAQKICAELQAILPEGPRRAQMIADLRDVRDRLRDNSSAEPPIARAAREILDGISAID